MPGIPELYNKMWLLSAVSFCLVQLAYMTPTLTIKGPTVVSLAEEEVARTDLMTGISCLDPSGNLTRAYKRSMTPSNPCGNCFQIWPTCDSGKGYCLVFNPGEGTLNYASVQSYVITVECTDDYTVDTKTVEVRLIANTPPVFVNPDKSFVSVIVRNTDTKRAGDIIYSATADDVDNDALFYTMGTDPTTDLLEIGSTEGIVRAKNDLRLLCQDSVDLYITVTDSHNDPVGPAIVDMKFTTGNVRPVITNTESLVEIPEDPDNKAPVLDRLVLGLLVNDNTVYKTLQYKLRAIPERGLEYYKLSFQTQVRIRTRTKLDYEYEPLRSVLLCVDVHDGFCAADPYCFTVQVTDVNEPPIIVPAYVEKSVYEGFITLDPGWKVVDPDENESHRWVMTKNGGNTFYIDQDSGVVYSRGDYDLDPNKISETRLLDVEVTDKGGLKTTAQLKVTVWDKNDNPPYFNTRLYEFTASPCTKTGALIGKLFAKDDDSIYQGNNQLVYWGSGRNITVLSTGDVALLSACTIGQSESIQGFVTDQGTYPGPLEGVPCTIEFTCNPCPEPVPKPSTTTTATVSRNNSNSKGFLEANLGWIIPAIILGILMLALLPYLIYRCCTGACARWRRMRALRAKSPRPNRIQPKPAAKAVKAAPKPEAKPRKQITPPQPPPPDAEPFFFGFWKETFPDRDQRQTPKRDAVPASVAQDKKMEEQNKLEEKKEREERLKERKKVEEQYQKEVEKYQQELIDINGPPGQFANKRPAAPTPAPPKKKGPCAIL